MYTKSISTFFGRIIAAVMIVTLALGAAPVQPAHAAAAQLDAWTPLAFGASGNNATINAGNITVSTGTNRLFVGAACLELSNNQTMSSFSMSLDGTPLTQIGNTEFTNATLHCYMGYLLDADIPVGATALTVPYNVNQTGVTVTGAHVWWASFSGINQTTPINDSNGPNGSSNGAANVTFGQQIDYLQNGVTFFIGSNITQAVTPSKPATFSTVLEQESNGFHSSVQRITTVPHAANGNYAAGTTLTFTGTGVGARSILIVASLRPYVAYDITSSVGAGTGTITPLGSASYVAGSNQTFDIVPGANNIVSGVSIDGGASVGRVNHYTFTNIQASHTIVASFDGGWSEPGAYSDPDNDVGTQANVYTSNDSYALINNTTD